MEPGGWILMAVSLAFVLTLVSFCVFKVIFPGKPIDS